MLLSNEEIEWWLTVVFKINNKYPEMIVILRRVFKIFADNNAVYKPKDKNNNIWEFSPGTEMVWNFETGGQT